MASTILKYPDGRTEERKVISYFEKNDLKTIVFDMEEKLNNNYKTHVSYFSPDGRYQNVVNEDIWHDIKGILVDGIHAKAKDAYRPVPAEILVTEDPSRELFLRPDNYLSLTQNYQDYLNSLEVVEQPVEIVSEVPQEMPQVAIEPQMEVAEADILPFPESVVPEVNTTVVDETPKEATIVPLPGAEEVGVVDTNAALQDNVVPMPDVSAEPLAAGNESFQDIVPDAIATPDMSFINPAPDVVMPVVENNSVINFPDVAETSTMNIGPQMEVNSLEQNVGMDIASQPQQVDNNNLSFPSNDIQPEMSSTESVQLNNDSTIIPFQDVQPMNVNGVSLENQNMSGDTLNSEVNSSVISNGMDVPQVVGSQGNVDNIVPFSIPEVPSLDSAPQSFENVGATYVPEQPLEMNTVTSEPQNIGMDSLVGGAPVVADNMQSQVINPTPIPVPVNVEVPVMGVGPQMDMNVLGQNISTNPVVSDPQNAGLDSLIVGEPSLENSGGQVGDSISVIDTPSNLGADTVLQSVPGVVNATDTMVASAPTENASETSAVTNSYLTKVKTIMQETEELAEEYNNKISSLRDEYIKKMQEKEAEINGALLEAKQLNELSRQTFDKAQTLSRVA